MTFAIVIDAPLENEKARNEMNKHVASIYKDSSMYGVEYRNRM
jgi:hypothetical protein